MFERLEAPGELIDHKTVDWSRVRTTAYLLHQHLRYEYPGPISNLSQRLVVFPPDLHGGQHLVARHLQVSLPNPAVREESDPFGNRVCHLFVPRVEHTIEFEVRFLVERQRGFGGVPAEEMGDPAYLRPSPLTAPNARFAALAERFRADDQPAHPSASSGQSLAERITDWVWRTIAYTGGVTNVRTTAADALELGHGVCQDHAHVMLTLCRLLGQPARYVSGHLLGEGATHAWVEVLAPDPDQPTRRTVQAFDPSHGRRCRPDYITVAVGRGYGDVAPTSGLFSAPYGGQLHASKRAGITSIEYAPAESDEREQDRPRTEAEPTLLRARSPRARSA